MYVTVIVVVAVILPLSIFVKLAEFYTQTYMCELIRMVSNYGTRSISVL